MKTQNLFSIVLTLLFFNSCKVLTDEKKVYQKRVNELKNIGWSKSASEHIAKVEFNIIPEDSLYISYMED
jgi:hypothetical protein